MNLLTQNSAIQGGHDLWVLPHYQSSQWTPQIDWMMNFQILKTSRVKFKSIDLQIYRILKENEIHLHQIELDTDYLLIPTQLFFSNRWVLYCSNIVNSEGEVLSSRWLKDIHRLWKGLKNPSLRIFLPRSVHAPEIYKEWQSFEPEFEIAIVPDPQTVALR